MGGANKSYGNQAERKSKARGAKESLNLSLITLKEDPLLAEYRIRLDFGEAKNPNHNPVAEKAIQELEKVLIKLLPEGGTVSEIILAKATENLNKIIRHSGYNAQELLTNRDQTSGAKMDLTDSKLSDLQWKMRVESHESSSKYKSRDAKTQEVPQFAEGDIVFLKKELSKHRARERYFVVKSEDTKALIQKITCDQIRAKQYLVKAEEVMKTRSDDGPKSNELNISNKSSDEEVAKNKFTSNKIKRTNVPRKIDSKQYPSEVCSYCAVRNFIGIHHSISDC